MEIIRSEIIRGRPGSSCQRVLILPNYPCRAFLHCGRIWPAEMSIQRQFSRRVARRAQLASVVLRAVNWCDKVDALVPSCIPRLASVFKQSADLIQPPAAAVTRRGTVPGILAPSLDCCGGAGRISTRWRRDASSSDCLAARCSWLEDREEQRPLPLTAYDGVDEG